MSKIIFFPANIYTTKKAGLQSCCSAYRGSDIAFRNKQQHRSPRRTYNISKVHANART